MPNAYFFLSFELTSLENNPNARNVGAQCPTKIASSFLLAVNSPKESNIDPMLSPKKILGETLSGTDIAESTTLR